MRSEDLVIGDFIQMYVPDLGSVRRMEIVKIDDNGMLVKWFDPNGVGPYSCVLPHGSLPSNTLHKNIYADERGGSHESYFKTHSDFTGKTGEV
jgi:hypothetical protein